MRRISPINPNIYNSEALRCKICVAVRVLDWHVAASATRSAICPADSSVANAPMGYRATTFTFQLAVFSHVREDGLGPLSANAGAGSRHPDLRYPAAPSLMLATYSAIARAAVKPGDSMPNRLINPGTPCAPSVWIMKSCSGPSGPRSFGRIPV